MHGVSDFCSGCGSTLEMRHHRYSPVCFEIPRGAVSQSSTESLGRIRGQTSCHPRHIRKGLRIDATAFTRFESSACVRATHVEGVSASSCHPLEASGPVACDRRKMVATLRTRTFSLTLTITVDEVLHSHQLTRSFMVC